MMNNNKSVPEIIINFIDKHFVPDKPISTFKRKVYQKSKADVLWM